MTTTARKPTATAKREFLERWMSDPEAYPEEFKSWLINFVQQNPNLLLDITSLPRIPASKFTPDALAIPLSIPVLREEASITALGGQAAGAYGMVNGTPHALGTLANIIVPAFRYDALVDDPPSGFKTQWLIEVQYETNATAPGGTHVFAMWEFAAVGGGAGGYTQTGAASFTTPTAISLVTPAASTATVVNSGWHDHGVAGDIVSGKTYGFGWNNTATLAANSAIQATLRLHRRFVPT